MPETLLAVRELEWDKAPGQPVFDSVNFTVQEGDIVVLTGKSGSGCACPCFSSRARWGILRDVVSHRKSTLLKCLAHLNIYKGEILYRGQ